MCLPQWAPFIVFYTVFVTETKVTLSEHYVHHILISNSTFISLYKCVNVKCVTGDGSLRPGQQIMPLRHFITDKGLLNPVQSWIRWKERFGEICEPVKAALQRLNRLRACSGRYSPAASKHASKWGFYLFQSPQMEKLAFTSKLTLHLDPFSQQSLKQCTEPTVQGLGFKNLHLRLSAMTLFVIKSKRVQT